MYTSSRGSPAGGVLLRGRRTRALFETRGLFQSVIPGVAGESVVVTNKVSAALFGLPFAVGLRGRVRPPSEEALEALQGTVADTVRVEFDPARLMLGNIELRVGTSSAVTLQTTYLDSKLRLGRGKLGSLFVFRVSRYGLSTPNSSRIPQNREDISSF